MAEDNVVTVQAGGCLVMNTAGKMCVLPVEHSGEHYFSRQEFLHDQFKQFNEGLDKFKAMAELLQTLQKKSTAAPAPDSQYMLAAKFVNYLGLKIRTNQRKTWDKVAVYEYVRECFSKFLVEHVTGLALPKGEDEK